MPRRFKLGKSAKAYRKRKRQIAKRRPTRGLFYNIAHKVYPYRVRVDLGTITSSYNSVVSDNILFKLSDMPTAGSYGGLYDHYKIMGVKVTFYPVRSDGYLLQPSSTATAQSMQTPLFVTAVDYDMNDTDAVPASTDELREYAQSKTVPSTKIVSWYIKPKIRLPVLLSKTAGTFSYSTPAQNPWIDKATTGVPYSGLRYAMDSTGVSTSAGNWKYQIEAVYYIAFKNTR